MNKFLREPFVHFLALGAILFAGHALWQTHVAKTDRTILISPAEIEHQAEIFASENRRQPTDEDLEGLLFAHIEEQVLMREAQRLGLDEDDTIIRRRLAQKMRFMINDIGSPELPTRAELETWFGENPEAFIRPETRSFEHIYLSPKDRANTVTADAEKLLAAGPADDWESQGDAFISGRRFTTVAQPAVQRDFGTNFAQSLFQLPDSKAWQGPLNSAFGVHLIRLTKVTPEYLPEFKAIQAEVEAVWLDEANQAENAKSLETLIGRYRVEVEE